MDPTTPVSDPPAAPSTTDLPIPRNVDVEEALTNLPQWKLSKIVSSIVEKPENARFKQLLEEEKQALFPTASPPASPLASHVSLLEIVLSAIGKPDNKHLKEMLEHQSLACFFEVAEYHLDEAGEDNMETVYRKPKRFAMKESVRSIKVERWVFCEHLFNELQETRHLFDVTDDGKQRPCSWHRDDLEIVRESDCWLPHQDELDSPDFDPMDFVEDDDYNEGFRYSCCGYLKYDGDCGGCRDTKHRSKEIQTLYRKHTTEESDWELESSYL